MHKRLGKPSPAIVIACLALFVAGTGTSIAATHYLITSTKQIKPTVLAKLKGNKGPRGLTGAAGAAGAAGATHVVTRGASGAVTNTYSYQTASCAAGEVATGGGVNWAYSGGSSLNVKVVASNPVSNSSGVPYAWFGEIYNYAYDLVRADVYVICASP